MELSTLVWDSVDLSKRCIGSGRRGQPTNKAREKRNCSGRDRGCHGYRSEKSRGKSKGKWKERQAMMDNACIAWNPVVG